MKKLYAILLILCLLASLAACGGEPDPQPQGNQNGSPTDAATQPAQQAQTPDVISVVHPDFRLHDGFIEPVQRTGEVPEGYIGISNASDFAKIGLNPNASYILMADIDMSGTEFEPVYGFTGILEGNGYTVSNCATTIFGSLDGGTVRNLGVYTQMENTPGELGDFYDCAGGIASAVKNGAEVFNCWVDGSMTVRTSEVGGIARWVDSGSTIRSCYNSADISLLLTNTGTPLCGGICAKMGENVQIINCYNEGDLKTESEAEYLEEIIGGIVGQVDISVSESGSVLRVYNCRNSGDIWCGGLAAGIIGWAGVTEPYVTLTVGKCVNEHKTQFEGYYDEVAGILNVAKIEEGCIIVTNCCNRGVWCDYGLVGGDALQTRWDKVSDDLMNVVIEYSYNWSYGEYGISKVCKNLNYCYYRDVCDYSATVDGALFATVNALSQEEMRLESSYPGFDFETVWQMGEDYPEYRQTDY